MPEPVDRKSFQCLPDHYPGSGRGASLIAHLSERAADDTPPETAAPQVPSRSLGACRRAWPFLYLAAAVRRAPVTTGIVALNVLVFAAMAFTEGRVLKFNQQVLLAWGADYGPRTLTDQWWRLLSHAFLHLDLAHLSVNMLFLMLAGPLAEKFLGGLRFAFVCLFAAVAAGLWMVGWFPAKVSLGASGAVYGVVGCFLGCAVRAPRTIPRQLFRRQVGLLVLFSLIFLLIDYLDQESAFIAHGGGLLYGFVGGLLLGPISALRGRSGKRLYSAFGRLVAAH